MLLEVPAVAKVAEGFNGHVDSDECPCAGPYQLTGQTRRENFGVIVAESEDQAALDAQERNPDVFYAVALNPASLY
jgi:hypothetical protein